MKRVAVAAAVVLACTFGGTRAASATSIEFQATDLPDVPGGDVWRYDYFLSDNNFLGTVNGFTVFFNATLYSGPLTELDPDPTNWDTLVFDPDPSSLFSAGVYDALALVDNPPFVGPFSVSFIWLGAPGTTPGSQPFDIYHLEGDTPVADESGLTSPVGGAEVPEPSTLLLLATGAVAGRTLRKRRRQSDR